MEYQEYAVENSKNFSLDSLKTGFISNENFKIIHKEVALVTADILINYNCKGLLLVKRNNYPAHGEYFPVGGRILKGVPIEEFIVKKTKEECNLSIKDLKFLGVSRMFFHTDPFNHGAGTDTISLMFFANGYGEIKLDNLHNGYILVNKDNFQEISQNIHPYTKALLEECLKLI